MEKVIPNGLNYADIKPETIENQIKVVRFTPTANVQSAQPNDVVRFQMQGQGFYDPYSAYIKIRLEIDDLKIQEGKINAKFLDRSAHSLINRLVIRSQGTELERIEQYDVIAATINDMIYSTEQKRLHHFEGFPHQVHLQNHSENDDGVEILEYGARPGGMLTQNYRGIGSQPCGEPCVFKYGGTSKFIHYSSFDSQEISYAEEDGMFFKQKEHQFNDDFHSTTSLEFIIPIYSGIIGVLLPDKKLLPISLMPLEVEFTLNPHAFYSSSYEISRNYKVTRFEICAHMLFFEQEVHRSLEAVVAEHGIFINYNTFYFAPVTVHPAAAHNTLTQYAQLNLYFKSINSVHFVFLYSGFENIPHQRKLHFVSHQLNQLQLRNGTELTPSEPIMGKCRDGHITNSHAPFLIETYKAWNKMHDPSTDSAIDAISYCFDLPAVFEAGAVDFNFQGLKFHQEGNTPDQNTDAEVAHFDKILDYALGTIQNFQQNVGRCQFGISLEGEELGSDKSTVTGKEGLSPFDINMNGVKAGSVSSYVYAFVKADLIIYVRPDLVVQVLGK